MTTDDHEDLNTDETRPKARRSLQQMRSDALAEEGKNAWGCPSCGCLDFRVTNTWYSGANKKRLRICRNCGTPITTCEIPVPDGYLIQIKKTD